MTSSLIRGRPRRTASHISVRVAHAVLGGAAGVVWLVLPGMTISDDAPVAAARAGPVTSAASTVAAEDETSTADLVLPLLAVGAAGVLAGYGYVRRTRRARTRTTPGGAPVAAAPPPPLHDLDAQSRAQLAEADDWVRTSREELGFAEALFGAPAVEPFARAVRDAEAELSAAFRMRQRYDEGVPREESSRRQVLAGIVGRCQEAGRRLDAEAAGFDQLRGLEAGVGEALEIAEGRFRELAGRTGTVETTLALLGERYAPSATAAVTGHAEQAKDRLVFATLRLNQARQAADLGDGDRAAGHLRAAEGAVTQAATFVAGIDRLATHLSAAAGLVPATLTGAEAEIAGARVRLAGARDVETDVIEPGPAERTPAREARAEGGDRTTSAADVPPGELHARILHADVVLGLVRQELTAGPYDPLDALRRIVRAVVPVASGRAGVVPAAALLVARSTTALAAGFVATHRGAVGGAARTRLAEAERLLAPPPSAPPGRDRLDEPVAHLAADALARQARELAEQDVRVHGTPVAGAAEHASGLGGAVLGGILLGGDPEGGPPASFGGPRTRDRALR